MQHDVGAKLCVLAIDVRYHITRDAALSLADQHNAHQLYKMVRDAAQLT